MWQEKVAPAVRAGRLAVVGVVQEQHPDRARLYRQWRGFDWPILVDSLNLLGLKAVPRAVALDESGIVRVAAARPDTFERDFLERSFEKTGVPEDHGRLAPPWPHAELLYGGEEALDGAVARYEREATDGPGWFRLGVALKRRSESPRARPGDAQRAIEAWGRALAIDPNQYIWRRRIQQYGPRLSKPYAFYPWVERARDEIRARGEEPVPLSVEPAGSELLGRGVPEDGDDSLPDPDPEGRIHRDDRFVGLETLVTPARVRPGHPVRLRVTLRPAQASWNGEGGRTVLSLDGEPPGTILDADAVLAPVGGRVLRRLGVELRIPEDRAPGELILRGYVLYDVCEDDTGVCRRLRRDFTAVVTVDPEAPSIR